MHLQSKINREVAKKVACSPSRSFRSLRGRFVRQSRDHVAVALAGAAHRIQPIERGNVDRIAALAVGSNLRPDPLGSAASIAAKAVGQIVITIGSKIWNGAWRSLSGAQLHSYQRNQLPTTPDQKGHDQKDKEARGEQLATGMRGRRKVKTIIRFASVANRRLRCSLSAQSTDVRERHVFLRNFPTLHDRDTKSPPAFTARNIIPPNVAANPPFVHSIHQGSLDVTSK